MLAKHLVKNPKFKLNFRRLSSPIVTLANLKFGRSERAKETQKNLPNYLCLVRHSSPRS